MLFSLQWRINLLLTWLLCLSQIKTRGHPCAFSLVLGSNTCCSHANPCSLLVHPFELQVNTQSFGNLPGIQLLRSFSPLKIIISEIELPSIKIHSTTDTHS